MANGFGIAPGDRDVMAKALEEVGIDPSKAGALLAALLGNRHILIDESTYRELWIGANTYGLAE
jgi:predicted DsbA family dithiol-disulfide isomerase